MAFGGPNPGIWGESVRKALVTDDEHNAREHSLSVEQATLDKAELQEFERSGAFGEAAPVDVRPPSRLRTLLGRLFHRDG
jgi:hypothetical protein